MGSGGYKKLIAWQKGMELVEAVYRLTDHFPPRERFGLTQQVRRAAMSVPVNISEGHGRGSQADFARFLDFALGSANEVETELLAAQRLGIVLPEQLVDALSRAEEIQRILWGLISSVRPQNRRWDPPSTWESPHP